MPGPAIAVDTDIARLGMAACVQLHAVKLARKRNGSALALALLAPSLALAGLALAALGLCPELFDRVVTHVPLRLPQVVGRRPTLPAHEILDAALLTPCREQAVHRPLVVLHVADQVAAPRARSLRVVVVVVSVSVSVIVVVCIVVVCFSVARALALLEALALLGDRRGLHVLGVSDRCFEGRFKTPNVGLLCPPCQGRSCHIFLRMCFLLRDTEVARRR